MGSFLIKCFASGQAINERARCYIAPILQAATYTPAEFALVPGKPVAPAMLGIANSVTGCGGFWQPWAIGWLEGTYDDYGDVELVESNENLRRLCWLFGKMAQYGMPVLQGENKYHDTAFDPSSLPPASDAGWPVLHEAFKAMQRQASEHRLFARNAVGQVRPLEFATLHGVAYDALLSLGSKRNDAATLLSSAANEAARADISYFDDHAQREQYLRKFLSRKNIEAAFTRISEVQVNDHYVRTDELLDTEPVPVEQLQLLLNDSLVWRGLDEMNIKLQPIEYAGQHYNNKQGRRYADFVHGCNGRIDAQLREQYGEEEEENED